MTDAADIGAAAHRISEGGLLAFPTETVYGLGARADDDRAVAAIYAAKGRPADHPLIVHVASPEAATAFCAEWPAPAAVLAAACWPGPLTLIVTRRAGIAAAAAAGQPTIGLRCPAHPVAQALLAACERLGVPGVAAPSANRYGRISPTRAAHVRDEFGDAVPVLDGGDCAVGVESTIVDCTAEPPVLLRPGGIPRRRIEALLGHPLAGRRASSPRAPGSLASHYAPRARLELVEPADLPAAALRTGNMGTHVVAIYSRTVPAQPLAGVAAWRRMPGDPEAAARELFAVLRELDAAGVERILVEMPPPEPAWEAVRDRLSRAAA